MSTDIAALIAQAQSRYDAMSPVEKAIHDLEQRKSGARGLSKMSTPREQIDATLDALPEYIVLSEYQKLRKEVVAIEMYAVARSRDAALEMHERQQWRRMVVICKRALGEADG
jgi:hypothetical protein